MSDGASYKAFWSRYHRAIAKLKSLGLDMNDGVISHKAAHSLRVSEGQLPKVSTALQTSGDATSLKALGDLAVKMYETHLPIAGHTDVYAVNPIMEIDEEPIEEGESYAEWGHTDEYGQTFLMRPGKGSKGKNDPGAAESARRGAVANFRTFPNSKSTLRGQRKRFVLAARRPQLASRLSSSMEGCDGWPIWEERKRGIKRSRGITNFSITGSDVAGD